MLIVGEQLNKSWYSHIWWSIVHLLKITLLGFPGGAVVENPPANAGDMSSIPGPESSHMPQSN